MDSEDTLGNLDPIVSENLREIITSLSEYANNNRSGIPERLKKLEDAGYIAEVSFLVKLGQVGRHSSAPAGEPRVYEHKSRGQKLNRADLAAASEMGFSLEEVIAVEAKVHETSYEAVLRDLRENATKLSPRVRNWMCSYVSHTFPQLNVRAPGPDHLADDKIWLAKLADIIARIMTLPAPQKELETLLSHMERLKGQ